jgi:hypothetical protein
MNDGALRAVKKLYISLCAARDKRQEATEDRKGGGYSTWVHDSKGIRQAGNCAITLEARKTCTNKQYPEARKP